MNDGDSSRVERMWRIASDSDVAGALRTPDDLEEGVFAIVQGEAERRQIKPTECDRLSPRQVPRVVRFGHAVHAFLAAHRCVAATLPGFLVPLCGVLLTPRDWLGRAWPIWSAGLCLVYLGGLAACAWPLRSYSLVMRTALVAGACFASANIANMLHTFPGFAGEGLALLILVGPATFAVFGGIPSAILCGVVWLRRRYWPVYGPGRCVRCGYDLRGLPSPRCPECGTSFTGAEPGCEQA